MKTIPVTIRLYDAQDWAQVWVVLEPVFRLGQTYAFATDISEGEHGLMQLPQNSAANHQQNRNDVKQE